MVQKPCRLYYKFWLDPPPLHSGKFLSLKSILDHNSDLILPTLLQHHTKSTAGLLDLKVASRFLIFFVYWFDGLNGRMEGAF
jgi:hypothetical protein